MTEMYKTDVTVKNERKSNPLKFNINNPTMKEIQPAIAGARTFPIFLVLLVSSHIKPHLQCIQKDH